MKPKWIVGIIIGSLLIYLGIFGGAGIGFALSGSYFKETCDSFAGWAVAPTTWGAVTELNPAGQYHMKAGAYNSGSDTRSYVLKNNWGTPADQFSVEIRIKVDTWGSDATHGGFFMLEISSATWFMQSVVNASFVTVLHGNGGSIPHGYTSVSHNSGTDWHTWTWLIDHAGNTVTIYYDSTKLGDFQTADVPGATGSHLTFDVFWANDQHLDWIFVDQGLIPPGSGGGTYPLSVSQPTGGYINLNPTQPSGGYTSGTSVTVSLTVQQGYTFQSWSVSPTPPTGQPTTISFTLTMTQSYSVSCTLSGGGSTSYTVYINVDANCHCTVRLQGPSFDQTLSSATSQSFASGSSITITANPSSGYEFDYWDNGGTQVRVNPYTFTLTNNQQFKPYMKTSGGGTFSVTTSVGGSGGGSVSSGGSGIVAGSSFTITASPNSGYVFDYWMVGTTQDTFGQGSSGTVTKTIIGSSGVTYTVQAFFKSSGTIPDPWADFIAKIKLLLNSYQAKTAFLAIGGLVTAVSCIMLVLPSKKKPQLPTMWY